MRIFILALVLQAHVGLAYDTSDSSLSATPSYVSESPF